MLFGLLKPMHKACQLRYFFVFLLDKVLGRNLSKTSYFELGSRNKSTQINFELN
ncbi:hypothetical protein AHMF7616_01982 [Adhaeribacter pallidiroseus]|uniref:Uncharacterized protein n=1 Tax=Adhaeribacter pallidiroseus TaxID=2072847 RepID=A0A369QKK3_9BACT|nr:hypothetical protein AHMF7616_01982 [Adhaeribacter pallidiroseus]